jgi:hypothetical protein
LALDPRHLQSFQAVVADVAHPRDADHTTCVTRGATRDGGDHVEDGDRPPQEVRDAGQQHGSLGRWRDWRKRAIDVGEEAAWASVEHREGAPLAGSARPREGL